MSGVEAIPAASSAFAMFFYDDLPHEAAIVARDVADIILIKGQLMTPREQRLSYQAHKVGGQFAEVAAISEIAAVEDSFAHRITTVAREAYLKADANARDCD